MLLLFKKIKSLLALLLFSVCSNAQVEINNAIIFTNENDSLSQIENLGTITDSTDLLNFGISTNEKIISLRLFGSGNYTCSVPYSGFALTEGMQFHLLIDTSNQSNPNLSFGSGSYPVLFQNGDMIPSFKLENNSILRVIFNGSEFRILQSFRNSCPPGFYSVNDNYCIEIAERPLTTYTNAVNICQSQGAQLCSWGEWYYACANLNGTAVFNMSNNWEFIDDASDHNDTYAVVGAPGFGGCQSFFSENVDLFNRNFRCCYKK